MSIRNIGGVLYQPIGIIPQDAIGQVEPSTRDILRIVLNSGFDAARYATMSTMPLALANPMLALSMPLIQMGLTAGQVLTNQALTSYNQYAQPRDLGPYNQGPVYLPPFQQRYSDPYGWGGQYATQQMQPYFPTPIATPQQMPQGGVGTYTPATYSTNPSVYTGSAQATSYAATAGAGFAPTGDSTFDLANAIANAPTYSPTEQALLSKIKDPEQRAIQELQMQMQKQALLCTVLTNLANMRHEMLKAVAQNLRS